jgi:bifunctional DNA-binding transcriptional regulator/antitoxin component of YhaV-PrlF toxin-antitoxin module
MSEKMELVVGKRGEIYTTREVRERIGLVPGGRALASIEENTLVIQPKPTALSLLRMSRIDAEPLSPDELSKLRKELAERLEVR